MFKNFIIIILIILLGSLLFNNKENVEHVISNIAETKNLIVDGSDFVVKTFKEEFTVTEEPFTVTTEPMIREETFFEEKK